MTATRAPGRSERMAGSSVGSTDPELFACAAVLGVAIFVGEGSYSTPMVTTFFALLCASVALAFWLIRAGSFVLPVGLGWLLAMLLVGSVSAGVVMAGGEAGTQTDLIRDVAILLSYAGLLLAGYYFGRERGAVNLVWWVLIVVGVLTSLIHLWLFVGQITAGVSDVYVLRLEAGRGDQVQVVAVIAACLVARGRRPGDFWTKVAVWSAGLCVLSITLALSRLLLMELIIVAMVFAATRLAGDSGHLQFRLMRAFTVAAAGVAALTLAVVALRFTSEAAFTFVYEGFIEKLLNSWTEIASTQQQSAQGIDENYRAFESGRGTQSFIEAGWFAQWFGQGWGAAVDLGLDTASTRSDFVRTEAAFLHNGYINYMVKVGLVGLACYIGFMLRLVHFAVFEPVKGDGRAQSFVQRQGLLALVLCLGVATLTVGGFGFPSGNLSMALLIGTCLSDPPTTWAGAPVDASLARSRLS